MSADSRPEVARRAVMTTVLCLLLQGAGAVENKDIVPSDVFAAAAQMRANVDTLRHFMGKPTPQPPDFGVSGAEPREVYFAARALFEKANEFATQMTSVGYSQEIPLQIRNITPANVLEIVKLADRRIRVVMDEFDIAPASESLPWADGKKPSDV